MTLSVPLRAIALALFIHTLWGGNPVAVKFGLIVFPPMWSAFIRFVLATLCIVVWIWARGTPFLPRRGEWLTLLGLGALFTAQIGTMNVGFDMTTGAMASVLISTNPLFAALFAHWLLRGDRLTAVKSAGLLLAFVGTAVVLLQGAGGAGLEIDNWGNWIVLLSACLLGLRLVLAARVLQRIDEARVAVWQMVVSLPLFAIGGLAWETVAWQHLDWRPVAGLAYQGFVIAGLGFMVTFYLMKRYTPSVMVSFNFVAPIAGVLLSAWLLDERITTGIVFGMILVASGLLLIARR